MVSSINRSINSSHTPAPNASARIAIVAGFATALVCGNAVMGAPRERTIAISKSGCAQAAQYVSGKEAAYVPGVDRQGRAVVPADIQGESDIFNHDSLAVVLSADLEERFGIPHDSALLDADAILGVVDVRIADGHLTFNGKTLSDRESYALSEICRRAIGPR